MIFINPRHFYSELWPLTLFLLRPLICPWQFNCLMQTSQIGLTVMHYSTEFNCLLQTSQIGLTFLHYSTEFNCLMKTSQIGLTVMHYSTEFNCLLQTSQIGLTFLHYSTEFNLFSFLDKQKYFIKKKHTNMKHDLEGIK